MRILLAAVVAAVAALVLAIPGAASAAPTKDSSGVVVVDPATVDSITYGSKSNGPDDGSDVEPLWERCLVQGSTGNEACFEDYGDKFNVYDGDSDGASAAAYWWTDSGRSGICYNAHQAGSWAQCNYDMREDGVVYWQTCYQNRSAGGDLYCTTTVVSKAINGDW
ncbi:hypothetical protein GCM10023317_18160 [Actinopolymorpha pittospori]